MLEPEVACMMQHMNLNNSYSFNVNEDILLLQKGIGVDRRCKVALLTLVKHLSL